MSTPHRYPVCSGRGLVPHGFYLTVNEFASTNTTPEECRTCKGQGILWSRQQEPVPLKVPRANETVDAVSQIRIGDGPWMPTPEYEIVWEGPNCVIREKPRAISGDPSDRANWKGKR